MTVIALHRRDLLHPVDEPDIWVNIVGDFRRVDGIDTEHFADELVGATLGVAAIGDDWVRLTCVLDSMPAQRLRRVSHTILREARATAEVEWRYEIAPQLFERLGVREPRPFGRAGRARARLATLLRRS